MNSTRHSTLYLLSMVVAVALVALLAWLTLAPEPDPCAETSQDVGAAVLADDAGDQEALVNRALLRRGRCARQDEPAEDN